MADLTLESTEEIIQLVSVSGSTQGDIVAAVAVETAAREAADTAHAALDTGVHGVGASTVASAADVSSDIAAHDDLATAHGVASGFWDASVGAESPSAGNVLITDSAADTLITTHDILSAAHASESVLPSDSLILNLEADNITGLSDGDLIATWNDTSGIGNNATAAGALRPTYKIAAWNNLPAVRFGGSQSMVTPPLGMAGTKEITVFIVAYISVYVAATQVICSLHTSLVNGTFNVNFDSNNKANFAANGGAGFSLFISDAVCCGIKPSIYCGMFYQTKSANQARGRIDGLESGTQSVNANNTNFFLSYPLYIGSIDNTQSFTTADIFAVRVYARALNDEEIRLVEKYYKTKYALGPRWGYLPLADNLYPEPSADTLNQYPFIRGSAFSRMVYSTTATSMVVTSFNDIYGILPTMTNLGVRVNGVDTATVSPGAAGQVVSTVVLGAGQKTVEIINGLQSRPSTLRAGTWMQHVEFNAPATIVAQTTSNTLYAVGDSIAGGANSTTACFDAGWQRVRLAYSGQIITDCFGYRSLYDDCSTAALQAALVSRIAGISPTKIWIALGTNDYGIPKQSAADFGTQYASLLDALHVALPSAIVYAQTPIVRSSEVANSYGDTLGAYRTQIATAQSTRSAWCTLVDGTGAAFPQTGDLDDGVHPTTAGQIKMGNAIKGILGI